MESFRKLKSFRKLTLEITLPVRGGDILHGRTQRRDRFRVRRSTELREDVLWMEGRRVCRKPKPTGARRRARECNEHRENRPHTYL